MLFFNKKKRNVLKHSTSSSQSKKNPIHTSLRENEKKLQEVFSDSFDFISRKMNIFGARQCIVTYIHGLVDMNHLDNAFLKPLMDITRNPFDSVPSLAQLLEENIISIAKIEIINQFQDVLNHIVDGDVILLIDKSKEAIALSIRQMEHRTVEEPSTEVLIRGPRAGFVELLKINTSLIRRIIHSPDLKMEALTVGSVTHTKVIITYIKAIASDTIVQEVKKRIAEIDIDSVLESGYIEELIRDAPYSPFPLMQITERPDTVAGSLIEGKVAILVEGTPFSLILPITFWSSFLTAEDYYNGFIIATLVRWLRYFSSFVALTFPSLYIAITTYHQEMIPTNLALSIAASREGIPFPALVEALIMEITFEALREAGLRMPRQVGQTISIIGALVLGQAAIQADIVSAPMVIVVSMTGIASFITPRLLMSQAIRILRLPMMFLAGSLGLYGMGIMLIALLIHLVNLRSFGVPYLTPIAPFNKAGLKDVLYRAPWWVMKNRTKAGEYSQVNRISSNQGDAS